MLNLVLILFFHLGSEAAEKKNQPTPVPAPITEKAPAVAPSGLRKSDRYFNLSQEERQILDNGEIGTGRYVVGGILGTYPLGLGIGHAIQGRYSEKGWIFTVGELASVALAVTGLSNCVYSSIYYRDCDVNGPFWLGIGAYIGFRIWEIVDVWAAPPQINRRYQELKRHMDDETRIFILPKDQNVLVGLCRSF